MVEVQRARSISAAIEDRTGVRHASPQAILVKGGKVVWHTSHGINARVLEDAFTKHAAAPPEISAEG
jgi:bacillithiol system protein YtxJ